MSATFTGTEEICSIDANHMNMSKFSSREDAGYERVAYTLNTVLDDLSNISKRSVTKGNIVEKDKFEKCQ